MSYAKFLWRVIHIVFGVIPPLRVELLFNRWYKQGGNQYNSLLLTGAAAFGWSIWLTTNDIVFDKSQYKTYLQVLFEGCIGYAYGPNYSVGMREKKLHFTSLP
jgi:hypothetical protein